MRITDELLELLGIDRVYQDERNNQQYIITDEGDTVFLFDVDDNTGHHDKRIPINDFHTYFADITMKFYADILQFKKIVLKGGEIQDD